MSSRWLNNHTPWRHSHLFDPMFDHEPRAKDQIHRRTMRGGGGGGLGGCSPPRIFQVAIFGQKTSTIWAKPLHDIQVISFSGDLFFCAFFFASQMLVSCITRIESFVVDMRSRNFFLHGKKSHTPPPPRE